VQIVSPVSDAPTFTDPSKHLLAATAAQTFRDQQPGTAGAQGDVVACTSRAGTAKLFVGRKGDAALSQLGAAVSTVAAAASDGCPAALGFVAKFPGVTLPESTEGADGSLTAATELRVDVTDVSTASGSSPVVDIWVDSLAPVVSLGSPANLCGSFHQGATFTTAVDLASDTGDVTLTITNGTATDTLTNPSFTGGVATFSTVPFDQGQSSLAGTAADRAGNHTALAPAPCLVTVGAAPVVVFTSPASGQQLCPAGSTAPSCVDDASPGTLGWQGPLTVHVTAGGAAVSGGTVTFSVGAMSLGQAAINASGDAQLPPTTLFDGTVTITATTSDIPGHGVGSGSVTVVVDTGPPDAPVGLSAAVLDRRQTSFQLSWTAPSDNGQPVTGYQVRYATVPIDASNFDNASVTTAVTYSGAPAAPGAADGVAATGLYIETNYFFAVAAVDGTGNRSPIAATAASAAAHFKRSFFPSMSGTNEQLGYSLAADGDLNGDGLSDTLAGTFQGHKAYLYFGSAGVVPAAPAVTFTGAGSFFGAAVAQVGDVDGDGLPDVAIGDPTNAGSTFVYVYKGRATWPAMLTDMQADYVIKGDGTYTGSLLGTSLARLGDFTGDGVDDFVIGARGFGASVGQAVIIRGNAAGLPATITLPDPAHAIVINGDATLGKPFFGYRVLGLGHFFTTTGTTLVVSAPGTASSAGANAGRVYAFRGQAAAGGSISLPADASTVGPANGARIGIVLANLGPLLGALPAVGIGNPADSLDNPGVVGAAYATFGTDAAGPFASKVVANMTSATIAVGGALLGGGLSGRDVRLSLIGDATPDLLLTGEQGVAGVASPIAILDGAKLAAKGSPVNATAAAEVSLQPPAGWTTGEAAVSLMPDVNGDGYPDFCLGNSFGAIPGGVAVYW
jgi:hypothetical protein